MPQSYTPLTCVKCDHVSFSFVSLLDGGANVSVVTLGLVKALGLRKHIRWKEIIGSSWNDTECTFRGTVYLTFRVAGRQFTHEFLVADKLATRTPALLGKDFLQKSEATLQYTPDTVKVTLKNGKKEVPLVKASEKIVTLNVVKANEVEKTKFVKSTFIGTEKEKKKPVIQSCEAKKIEPVFGSVIRVSLGQLPDRDWPQTAHVDYGEPGPGLVVEAQLVTVKKHQATTRSKHTRHCRPNSCVSFCPTKDYAYTHVYVFNGANETAYISPELKLGMVEPIWEAKIERPKVTKETTPVKTKRNEKTRETRKNIAVAKRKLKALRKRSAERKQASSQPQESETDRAEYMGSNYLNLDPEKDRRAYRRQYNEKHDPKIPLEDRRERVRNLIDEQYPKMHPMAKSELMRFPETVHLEGVPFVGVKTVKHRIEYSGPIYFQKQYKTPQVLEGEVLKEIDKLLEEDLIEGSDSGFSNAYLPVVKIDEKTKKRAVRLTLDMRRLNLGVIPDKLPIGDVQDILNRLHGCKYLSVIDASKGYLQIDLDEDSKKYTAFRHK